jgi:hypothetical protein
MAAVLGELADMVFTRNDNMDLNELSIDNHMLSVLINIDGEKNIQEIVKNTNLSSKEIKSAVLKLLKVELIQLQETVVSTLDEDFIIFLRTQLSKFVGPIASILLEDVADDLGYDIIDIPVGQAAVFVHLISKEISDPSKRTMFLKIIRASDYRQLIERSMK